MFCKVSRKIAQVALVNKGRQRPVACRNEPEQGQDKLVRGESAREQRACACCTCGFKGGRLGDGELRLKIDVLKQVFCGAYEQMHSAG